MKSLFMAIALLVTAPAFAGELDNDYLVANQELNETVVIRVDERDSSVSILKSADSVLSEDQAQALAHGGFSAVESSKVRSELDQDSGASSWYVYWYRYGYTPYYCYQGATYYPYYTYRYGYYSYYYYGSYSAWWR